MPPVNTPKNAIIYLSFISVALAVAGAAGGIASKVFAQKADVATLSAQMLDMREQQARMGTKQDRTEAKLDRVYEILIKK